MTRFAAFWLTAGLWAQTGDALFREELYVRAEETYRREKALPPASGCRLALIAEMNADWDAAEKLWLQYGKGMFSETASRRLAFFAELRSANSRAKGPLLATFLLGESRAALQSGRPVAAALLARRMLELPVSRLPGQLTLAEALAAVDDFAGALAMLTLAEEASRPEQKAVVAGLAADIRKRGRIREMWQTAQDLRDQRKQCEAAGVFREVFQMDERRMDAALAAGLAWAECGRVDEASRFLRHVERFGPEALRWQAAKTRARLAEPGEIAAARKWLRESTPDPISDPELERDRAALAAAERETEQELAGALAAARARREQQGDLKTRVRELTARIRALRAQLQFGGVAPRQAGLAGSIGGALQAELQVRLRVAETELAQLEGLIDRDEDASLEKAGGSPQP